jgi:hypothetical protein
MIPRNRRRPVRDRYGSPPPPTGGLYGKRGLVALGMGLKQELEEVCLHFASSGSE